MSYKAYGISTQLVEKVKKKMKQPAIKERVKKQLDGVTKADLQNPAKVSSLLSKLLKIVGVSVDARQREAIIRFVLDQKIDPNNTFHLIKLWGMFR